MEGAAVLQSYGFDLGLGDAGNLERRVSKRRRVANLSGDHSNASFGTWQQHNAHHLAQGYTSSAPSSPYPVGEPGSAFTPPASDGTTSAFHHDSAASDLASDGQHWNQAVSYAPEAFTPYPDVASYHHPYFYGQTDPATYNTPWPPTSSEGGGYRSGYSDYISSIAQRRPDHQQPRTHHGLPFVAQPGGPDLRFQSSGADSFHDLPDLDAVEQFTLQSGVRPPSLDHAREFFYEDASMHLKIQSLPSLDSLTTQLIQTIARCGFPQIQELMRGGSAEETQAYSALKDLFDQTRKVYSRDNPFIDAVAVQMFQPGQQEIIRKANIATFVSSILGAHDISFFHLNQYFMETFVPLGNRLLKWQGAVYLELKTQTYISALMNSDTSPETLLDELFPSDVDVQLLSRHPDAPTLSPSEQDFIDRSRARRSYLFAEPTSEEALSELTKKYQWNDFVREFAGGISKNIDGILSPPSRAQSVFGGGAASVRTAGGTLSSIHDSVGLINGGSETRDQLQSSNSSVALQQAGSGGTQYQQHLPAVETKRTATQTNSVRQPWTKAEEDALLSGLERVNGPHWSQILALYGRGGSVSELLKDRNQVQLKDKARNLKLWYLKMGKDVPISLRGVTGELRKRGGARARAALEAEEGTSSKDRSASEGADSEGIDPALDGRDMDGRLPMMEKARKKGGPR